MAQYLKDSLVRAAFLQLASGEQSKKAPMERTSGLMYFLALGQAIKKIGHRPLDFNPDTSTGDNNRREFTLAYARLVTLPIATSGSLRCVNELGKVTTGGTAPEKRVSSNFLTVPLKKASQASQDCFYPRRPAPVIKMGKISTGISWGIDFHDDWRVNLPQLLRDTVGKTPFTDLAIFVFRHTKFSDTINDLPKALSDRLQSDFTSEVAEYWSQKIDLEKIFARLHTQNPFSSTVQNILTESDCPDEEIPERPCQNENIARIAYLEELLTLHGIKF